MTAEPDVFPAASGQERMWFLARLEPDLAVYNVNLWIPLPPDYDLPLVREALTLLVRRHEVLRTTFRLDTAEPGTGAGADSTDGAAARGGVVQLVHPDAALDVTATDLRDLPAAEREPAFHRLARADAARPFALDRAPLWRARLVRLAADDLRLIWICDHTVFDGASSDPFVTELLECAAALAEGRPPRLVDLPIQFADYAVWQRGRLTDERVATELAHWRRVLADLPDELGLPTDRPRPPVRSYRGEVHRFALSAALTARVEQWSQRRGVTPFMTLLAAFKTLLSRWAGHPDIVVGCPMAGRALPELQPLIGMFVNAVVIRTDLGGDPGFTDIVHRVRAALLESIDHQELPFERIVEDLQRTRDLSRPPLYQVAFNLVPSDTRGQIANGTVKVDLALDLNVRDGRLHGRLEYATDLFDTATVQRLADTYTTLLTAALDDPDRPISRLPLLTAAQRAAVLAAGHGADVPLPAPALLTDLLDAQARRTPDAVAVVAGPDTLGYAALHTRANRLAHRLRERGVGPETPVAVCVPRRPDLVVALLAVLKAGGVLAPLDPDHPPARLAFQLADSRAAVVLTTHDLRERFAAHDQVTVVPVDEPDRQPGPDTPPPTDLHPEHAAYLLYTSGSTGRPKGVLTSHRSLVNRLAWMQQRFRLGTDDAVLHKTSAGFDVSLWELFWPLVTGARLVLAAPDGQRDPGYLRDEIVRSEVTTVHFVPSMLELFVSTDGIEACRSLRRIVCSGEELTRSLAERCRQRLPDTGPHNLYGPTEAAIDVSAWPFDPAVPGPVPIGRPEANTRLHVLDRWLEPLPVGFPGELYLGGVQLARGYLGRPGRTAGVFLPDPHGPAGARLYRTGDLARLRADGAVEYLGRTDAQVKVHGVRVELGEIESVLVGHPQVRRAVAAIRDDAPGGRGLVAYVDWAGEPTDAPARLRELLGQHLPVTLLPQAFVLTTDFPTSPSGKVDRAALPAPAGTDRTQVAAAYQPPGTPLEEELCALWAQLLGRDRVGVADDFFELGGHSLLAVQLVGRLRERYGVEFPLRRCFEVTTVGGHALEILALRLADTDAEALLAALEAGS
ncbi:non-ribosomal peptide synthetase [Micromonospora echinofusca]|uniref:Amino acid adenylation domain-containing protein n=1 Tax=Micromonospora echinofusca TaxID=47858 RepID=A0ABS3VTX5_MICEH|nr:non-ribosomal peptide synthetase [Micromonospora echinofusca]MBO4207991.1 amino acid adenylation domain-containing protein [Micromonospora echinofusca]